MTERKGWGQTVLGWFVVKEDEGEALPPDLGTAIPLPPGEAAPASPAPPPPPPPVTFAKEVPRAQGGVVDFDGVFDAAGIDAGERDLFAKAQALLAGLPPGTDPAIRKQIVEASLKAFGIPIEKIIETGVESIQVLEAYLQKGGGETASFASEVGSLIEGYEQKIRDARALLDRRLAEQAGVQTRCNEKKLEVQRVLEFFGQDAVARVVKESPKLVDPAAPAGG